jgi:1,4-dihydroxy-2-naphthoyl-CoA hydrolase
MTIWRTAWTIDALEERQRDTLGPHLGMRITEVGPDFIRISMPVDARTKQPMGLLHGGASLALAETAGSLAASLTLDPATHVCVGQEINGNHLRPVTGGTVTGTARPVHLGRRSQVWQIDINDERGHLVCVSRLTMAIIDRKELSR